MQILTSDRLVRLKCKIFKINNMEISIILLVYLITCKTVIFVWCIVLVTRGLACPTQLIFFLLIFIPWYMPNLTTEELCLLLWICEYWIPYFGVCAGKHCPSWELNPGSSIFRADALPTELWGQLRIQRPWCPSVLLVRDGLSPTHWVATPSDTQHAIFALFWAPQCSAFWQLLCLFAIEFCDCDILTSVCDVSYFLSNTSAIIELRTSLDKFWLPLVKKLHNFNLQCIMFSFFGK